MNAPGVGEVWRRRLGHHRGARVRVVAVSANQVVMRAIDELGSHSTQRARGGPKKLAIERFGQMFERER